MDRAYERILAYVQDLEIIDTHEHLPGTEATRERDGDVLHEYLFHYMSSDLRSAGLSARDLARARDATQPLAERWALVEPYWERARYTGYGRALDRSVRGLYGLDGVRRETIEALNDAYLASLIPGHYRRVLKDACRISVSLLDAGEPWDPEFFRPVVRLDDFIMPLSLGAVQAAGERLGHAIRSLDDWVAACDLTLLQAREAGAVALKVGLAYRRSLAFPSRTRADAEAAWGRLLSLRHVLEWDGRPVIAEPALQDWMMHHALELAAREGMPVQVHTGLQEGNGNYIANSDPALLSNLFLEYPEVDFDLFHIGYPYQHVLSALAKMFPNVYIDMCWAHIISPTASVRALEEWIDSVPLNKISAFGGDYSLVDGVYGHQAMARENVSRALATKVHEGVFDIDHACEVAHMLFIDNPTQLFHL